MSLLYTVTPDCDIYSSLVIKQSLTTGLIDHVWKYTWYYEGLQAASLQLEEK